MPEKNSNHIDTLTNRLPEGTINKYYQESLKNQSALTNDMNTIIGNMNSVKISQNINNNNLNLSKDKDLSPSNYNKEGKYVVPFSITKSHVIKDLQKYEEEMSGGKKRKKTYNAKSAGKYKVKKGKKNPPTLVNTIASIAQELIDNDEDLKDFKNPSPNKDYINENNINDKSEIDNNTGFKPFNIGNDEIMNYGKIDLNEIQIDPEQEKNIITKYNLIENNFSSEFQEQVPFYY